MDDRVAAMVRRLLRRHATSEDAARIANLVAELPPEVLASPAAVAEIVLRAEHLRRVEELIEKASWDAQQRIHRDLPDRIDHAALKALSRLRDQLPIDAADRVGRLLKWGAAWTAMVLLVAGAGGWMVRDHAVERQQARGRAAIEQAFNRCIDAVEGIAMTTKTDMAGLRYDSTVYRAHARACVAEYADRHAGG